MDLRPVSKQSTSLHRARSAAPENEKRQLLGERPNPNAHHGNSPVDYSAAMSLWKAAESFWVRQRYYARALAPNTCSSYELAVEKVVGREDT